MNKKNNKRTHFISIVVAFLLSIFITLICLLAGTYFGLLNQALLSDAMNKSSYYESVNSYTLEEAYDLAIPLGLDDTIFDQVFTLQTTYTEGKALLDANLKGEGYSVDTSEIQSALRSNITSYAQKNHITVDDTINNNIDYFTNQVCNIYVSNLTVPFLNYYAGIRSIFSKILIMAIPCLILLSVLCIFILLKIHRWIHQGLRYVAYSFIASALMVSIIPAYLLITQRYMNLNITPIYFYKLITNYISQSLIIYLYTAIVITAIAMFIIAAIVNIRRKLLK